MGKSPYLRFQEVVSRSDLNETTLRYYIRYGLLPEPRRCEAGQLEYPLAVLHRLAGIKQAKALGFTLREIKRMFSDSGWSQCPTTSKLQEVEAQIAQLTEQRDALLAIRSSCSGSDTCALAAQMNDPSE